MLDSAYIVDLFMKKNKKPKFLIVHSQNLFNIKKKFEKNISNDIN